MITTIEHCLKLFPVAEWQPRQEEAYFWSHIQIVIGVFVLPMLKAWMRPYNRVSGCRNDPLIETSARCDDYLANELDKIAEMMTVLMKQQIFHNENCVSINIFCRNFKQAYDARKIQTLFTIFITKRFNAFLV